MRPRQEGLKKVRPRRSLKRGCAWKGGVRVVPSFRVRKRHACLLVLVPERCEREMFRHRALLGKDLGLRELRSGGGSSGRSQNVETPDTHTVTDTTTVHVTSTNVCVSLLH